MLSQANLQIKSIGEIFYSSLAVSQFTKFFALNLRNQLIHIFVADLPLYFELLNAEQFFTNISVYYQQKFVQYSHETDEKFVFCYWTITTADQLQLAKF